MSNQLFSSISIDQLKAEITTSLIEEFKKHLSGFNQPVKQEELITRKQAAIVLGISLPTLNEWTKEGIVKGYRINSRVRYKRSELESSLVQIKSVKQR